MEYQLCSSVIFFKTITRVKNNIISSLVITTSNDRHKLNLISFQKFSGIFTIFVFKLWCQKLSLQTRLTFSSTISSQFPQKCSKQNFAVILINFINKLFYTRVKISKPHSADFSIYFRHAKIGFCPFICQTC